MDRLIKNKIDAHFSTHEQRACEAGEILIYAGEDPKGVYQILSGQIKQYDIAESGVEVVLNIFKAPAFFPMNWAILGTKNKYFFQAVTKCKYRIAPADETVALLKSNPDVTFDLLSRVLSGTDGLLQRMSYLMAGNAQTRLLFELVNQCRRFGVPQDKNAYILDIHENELAKRAGLSRETVSRLMKQLISNKLVTVNRQNIIINDLAKLTAELD